MTRSRQPKRSNAYNRRNLDWTPLEPGETDAQDLLGGYGPHDRNRGPTGPRPVGRRRHADADARRAPGHLRRVHVPDPDADAAPGPVRGPRDAGPGDRGGVRGVGADAAEPRPVRPHRGGAERGLRAARGGRRALLQRVLVRAGHRADVGQADVAHRRSARRALPPADRGGPAGRRGAAGVPARAHVRLVREPQHGRPLHRVHQVGPAHAARGVQQQPDDLPDRRPRGDPHRAGAPAPHHPARRRGEAAARADRGRVAGALGGERRWSSRPRSTATGGTGRSARACASSSGSPGSTRTPSPTSTR